GTFTTFDVSGVAISPDDTITGSYSAANGLLGFVRDKNGAITSFTAPVPGPGKQFYTVSLGINPAGTITGWYIDPNGVSHGFLRAKDGTFTTFDPPGASFPRNGTDYAAFGGEGFSGGAPINAGGAVTGFYIDGTGATHGFLLSPH